MKVRNLYALLVALVAAISLLLSCSDNDDPQPDPQPVLEPGEYRWLIPFLRHTSE